MRPCSGRPRARRSRGRRARPRSARRSAGSAEFWFDLLASTGLEPEAALPGALGPRLGGRGDERRLAAAARRAPLRRAEAGAPAAALLAPRARGDDRDAGPLVARRRGCSPATPDRRALAELLLERQGIVTRDGVRGEGIAGGYGAVYGELKALETLGLCRRGYFVEGLGGAQFALGGAVERLRELRPREDEEQEPLVLAAADPAQPYGSALPWPKRAGARAARVAGAYVVLLGGEPGLFVERGGNSMVPLRDPEPEWLRVALAALVDHARRFSRKRLAVERFDGEPVSESDACRSSSRPASSPARAGPSCGPSGSRAPGLGGNKMDLQTKIQGAFLRDRAAVDEHLRISGSISV